ncbi:MAG: ATP-binding protein [Pseudomonadota bacterium]
MFGLPRIFKTTAARLSALFVVLFGVCALLIIVYMSTLALGFVIRETRASVDAEIGELARVFNQRGLRGLVRDIERRSRQPGAFVYLVADARGRPLAGNIGELQPGILENPGWTGRPFNYSRASDQTPLAAMGEDAPRAVAQVFSFQNGMTIVVGRDLGDPIRFRVVIQQTVGLALGIMAVGGFLIWYFVGRRALRRIEAVSVASDSIIAGDLSQRLPLSGASDEFDRLSESLNQMLGRIEKLNDGLRDVSDSIAHDLKTPLTRLRNRAEDAIRTGQSDGDYRDALHDMIGEADNMISIFNAMLLISRVEAGYTQFTPAPVDIGMVAADLCELYEPVFEDAGGEIENTVGDDFIVQGSRELIGQAVTNLLDNSAKYGLSGDGKVSVSARRSGDMVELSVTDSGVGIAETDKARAVERFVRLDDSRTSANNSKGSGLGLALVSAIMRQHNGELVLKDANPGLVATLVFPPTLASGENSPQ